MRSSISSLLPIALLFSSACGLPASESLPPRYPKQQLTLEQLQEQQPTLPGLPSNSNVTLQYVGLGVGIQNYTCASTSATPTSIGAIATLFDITSYLQWTGDTSDKLSRRYLKRYLKETSCQASQDLSDNSCQENINLRNFPILGKHYFAQIDTARVPSFDIYDRAFLSAQRTGDVPAPADAFKGRPPYGAIDWLFLPSDGSSRTYGLSEAYRINTAGGAPKSCSDGDAAFSIKYAAEYWFYL